MEHRYSSRITVAGDVGIHSPGAGWAAGKLVDMSTRGALIAAGGNGLRPNTLITVVLGFDRPGESEWQLLHAVVVRSSADGIGIEYLEHDRRCARALCRVIDSGCRSPLLARGRATPVAPTLADNGEVSERPPAVA